DRKLSGRKKDKKQRKFEKKRAYDDQRRGGMKRGKVRRKNQTDMGKDGSDDERD
ncbi:hypothetical protein KI387_032958, partial [Taxus chinensis]